MPTIMCNSYERWCMSMCTCISSALIGLAVANIACNALGFVRNTLILAAYQPLFGRMLRSSKYVHFHCKQIANSAHNQRPARASIASHSVQCSHPCETIMYVCVHGVRTQWFNLHFPGFMRYIPIGRHILHAFVPQLTHVHLKIYAHGFKCVAA